jgi:hypothetical protein
MVRAMLDGRKTQTRRVVKHSTGSVSGLNGYAYLGACPANPHQHLMQCGAAVERINCPYGRTRDRLWVKETFRPMDGKYFYRATIPDGYLECHFRPWKPSIFCTRHASRITLGITAVRVERLQAISESDAWAEGIGREGRPLEALVNTCLAFPKLNIGSLAADDPSLFAFGDDRKVLSDYEKVTATSGRGVYAALWEGINGPGSWAENPFVWVVEFKRITFVGQLANLKLPCHDTCRCPTCCPEGIAK